MQIATNVTALLPTFSFSNLPMFPLALYSPSPPSPIQVLNSDIRHSHTQMRYSYPFEVQWSLYVPTGFTFKNSTFCPHSVFSFCCVFCGSQNKERLVLQQRRSVITARYELNHYIDVILRTHTHTVAHAIYRTAVSNPSSSCLIQTKQLTDKVDLQFVFSGFDSHSFQFSFRCPFLQPTVQVRH